MPDAKSRKLPWPRYSGTRVTPTPWDSWARCPGSTARQARSRPGLPRSPARCRHSDRTLPVALLPRAACWRPINAARPHRRFASWHHRISLPAGTPNVPRMQCMAETAPILEVDGLVKHFPVRRGLFSGLQGSVRAVDGISFAVDAGKTLSIVGESGCGKSTAARMIVRLIEPTSGTIHLQGADITRVSPSEMRRHRRIIQFIFQDPYSSLNPRLSAGEIVGEPLHNYDVARGRALAEEVARLFERVGLQAAHARKYPHEFPGGQR